jgi:sulfide:quinone oxidoreductase
LGSPREPAAFQPILRAVLLTGSAPLYLRADLKDGGPPSEVAGQPLWWPPDKIAGRYLSPYLAQVERGAPEPGAFEDSNAPGGE